MQVNEEKRKKFMEYAGKRVNNVLHGIQILEPMSRSNSYDFTRQDVDEMFGAMQESLNNARAEFEKKFEEKARTEKKTFTFGAPQVTNTIAPTVDTATTNTNITEDATTTNTYTSTNGTTNYETTNTFEETTYENDTSTQETGSAAETTITDADTF